MCWWAPALHWNYPHLVTKSHEHFLPLTSVTFPQHYWLLFEALPCFAFPPLFFRLPQACLPLLYTLSVSITLCVFIKALSWVCFLFTPYLKILSTSIPKISATLLSNPRSISSFLIFPLEARCFMDISAWQFKFSLDLRSASQTKCQLKFAFQLTISTSIYSVPLTKSLGDILDFNLYNLKDQILSLNSQIYLSASLTPVP